MSDAAIPSIVDGKIDGEDIITLEDATHELPTIKVWCLPDIGEDRLSGLHQAIVHSVVSLKGVDHLESEDDLMVLFPVDAMKYGLGREILIEISGLRNNYWMDSGHRYQLGTAVGECVRQQFPGSNVRTRVMPQETGKVMVWSRAAASPAVA